MRVPSDPDPAGVLPLARLKRNGLGIAWSERLTHEGLERVRFGKRCTVWLGTIFIAGDIVMGDDVQLGVMSNVRAKAPRSASLNRLVGSQFVSLIALNHKIASDGMLLWHEV